MINNEKNKETIQIKEVLDFRVALFREYRTGKIPAATFANRTYNHFSQYRMKFVKKAHDMASVIFNYLYWTSQIERRIYIERELASYGCADENQLEQLLSLFIKRRNQMFRRLLYEFSDQVTIEQAHIVVEDIVEIKLKEFDQPFYCNREVLDRLRINILRIGPSLQPYYLPFISYKINHKKT